MTNSQNKIVTKRRTHPSKPLNMKKSIVLKTVLIAAALPLFAGCVERQVVYRDRPVYAQPPPNAPPPQAEVVADAPAPPPPQVEVVPVAPDPTFIWIGGSWEWRNRWVWAGGHWDRPHPGRVWVRGGWVHRGHGRVWVEGHWR
jgi:hypothetical protein